MGSQGSQAVGRQAAAQPARPARGGGGPRHSPLSLDPDAFVPRTKHRGSAVPRAASLTSGRDGSRGLRVQGTPSKGEELPDTAGGGAVLGGQIQVQIPCFMN